MASGSETKINAFAGLYSSVDPFSRAPKGAFRVAQNVTFRQPGLVEPRRGFDSFVTLPSTPWALFCGLKDSLGFGMVHLTDRNFYSYISTSSDPLHPAWSTQASFMGPGAGMFSQYVAPHPDAGRLRFAQANGNTYAISAIGLLRWSNNIEFSHTVIPPCPAEDPNAQCYGTRAAVVSYGGTFDWLPNGDACAYKVRQVIQDANGNYSYGPPSAPVKVSNSAGAARSVRILLYLPPLTDSGTYSSRANLDGRKSFFEIYRTKAVTSGTDYPEDYYKVAEVAYATGPYASTLETGNGNVYFRASDASGSGYNAIYDDIVSEQGLGPPLETNPTDGDTAAVSFATCPAAADLAYFKGRMYVGNYIDVHRLVVPLVGVGSAQSIQVGDTLTIDGIQYTWTLPATGWSYQHPVLVSAAGSAFLNLLASANSLVGTINAAYADCWNQQYAGTASATGLGPRESLRCLQASYIGDTSQPGALLLERLVPGSPSFTVTYSTIAGGYGIVSGTVSDNNTQVGGVRYSEQNQPEDFPIANDITVGDAGKKILRLIGTKDSLWVFKEDGLFRITDDGQGPTVSVYDQNVRLIAPDSVVALNNEIYALCTQGVLRINEQGKDNISVPFQRELLELVAQFNGGDLMYSLASGLAYETEGQYILSLPQSQNSTANTLHYVYNVDAKAWSTYVYGPGMANFAVDPQLDKMIAATSTGYLWAERKDYMSSDHADPAFTVGIPAGLAGTAGTVLTFSSIPSPEIHVGDYIYQTSGGYTFGSWVRSVSDNKRVITLFAAPTHNWVNANLSVLPGIDARMEFLPIVGEDELLAKTYREHLRLYFQFMDHPFFDAAVSTDERPFPLDITNGRVPAPLLWGTDTGTWGSTLWGEDVTNIVSRVTITDEAYLRGAELDVDLEFTAAARKFELASIAVGMNDSTTDRVTL